VRLLLVDERELHSLSFAKNAAADSTSHRNTITEQYLLEGMVPDAQDTTKSITRGTLGAVAALA
jgi:hypothetical protein